MKTNKNSSHRSNTIESFIFIFVKTLKKFFTLYKSICVILAFLLSFTQISFSEDLVYNVFYSNPKISNSISDKITQILALKVGTCMAIVNGTVIDVDSNNPSIHPIIESGRTMVPVRFIAENFGAQVIWEAATKSVTISDNTISIALQADSKTMNIKDKILELDVSPKLKDGRMFLPLRAVSEAFMKNVYYYNGMIILTPQSLVLESSSDKSFFEDLLNEFKKIEPISLLKSAKNWAYQLQNIENKKSQESLINSNFDMLVIEPVRTEKSNEKFNTKRLVDRLKNSIGSDRTSRKLVIAYICIAEAENWRNYWTFDNHPSNWPSYIIGADPDGWAGDFPVAYWDVAWKKLLMSEFKTNENDSVEKSVYGSIYENNESTSEKLDFRNSSLKPNNIQGLIDAAISDGFDGIYLDWVEGYKAKIVENRATSDNVNSQEEMVKLLGEIREYTKSRNPGFLMIQQNACELYKGYPQVFDYIDAIAQEGIWYDGKSFDNWDDENGADIKNEDEGLITLYVDNLKIYKTQRKPVFNVEYANKFKDDAIKLSLENGFIPYCTRRPLSKLALD